MGRVFELYRAALDGTAPAVRPNGPLVLTQDVLSCAVPRGGRVVYALEDVTRQPGQLNSVPLRWACLQFRHRRIRTTWRRRDLYVLGLSATVGPT